jgi:2-polyprenyl-6-methoxyphenol hydroxylase-like FAD-dependent oxidoreductase
VTRVAIVGGGLGGLAAAAFLHQAGVPAVVYEQARELREVGAGIMVPPNAARMLRRLGVLDAFSERAVQLDIGWEFRRWRDGTVLSAQDLTAKSARLYGKHTYTVHRADLLDAVKKAVPADAVKLDRLCSFSHHRGSPSSAATASASSCTMPGQCATAARTRDGRRPAGCPAGRRVAMLFSCCPEARYS